MFELSKFDHTNIVKLIGICFDTRPYFIVLELLEGGDLKTFLRVRPQQVNGTPSLTLDFHSLLDLSNRIIVVGSSNVINNAPYTVYYYEAVIRPVVEHAVLTLQFYS